MDNLSGSEKLRVDLTENQIAWLVNMMAMIKASTACNHCDEEAGDLFATFMMALPTHEARTKAAKLAEESIRELMDDKLSATAH